MEENVKKSEGLFSKLVKEKSIFSDNYGSLNEPLKEFVGKLEYDLPELYNEHTNGLHFILRKENDDISPILKYLDYYQINFGDLNTLDSTQIFHYIEEILNKISKKMYLIYMTDIFSIFRDSNDKTMKAFQVSRLIRGLCMLCKKNLCNIILVNDIKTVYYANKIGEYNWLGKDESINNGVFFIYMCCSGIRIDFDEKSNSHIVQLVKHQLRRIDMIWRMEDKNGSI